MTIRARCQVFCLVAILLVAGGACGSEDSPSVQGVEGGPGANATTPEDADTPDEVRAGVLEFSRAIAASPYFASTDWSLQRDFSQASVGATAIVRGEITGLDVGPLTSSQMDEVHDATGGTGSRTVSLAIQVSVVSTNSDQIPEGSDIDVLIPIWLGPDGFVSEAEESHVRPLLEFDPSGLEILVAVASFDETERTVNVIEFGGVVIGTSDGASSVVLASPSADGRAWGIADLKEIESSVVATAQ